MTNTSVSAFENELTTLAKRLDLLESQSIGKDATEDWSALMYIRERISFLEQIHLTQSRFARRITDGSQIIPLSLDAGASVTNALTWTFFERSSDISDLSG